MSFKSPIKYNICETRNNSVDKDLLIFECIQLGLPAQTIIINEDETIEFFFSRSIEEDKKYILDGVVKFHGYKEEDIINNVHYTSSSNIINDDILFLKSNENNIDKNYFIFFENTIIVEEIIVFWYLKERNIKSSCVINVSKEFDSKERKIINNFHIFKENNTFFKLNEKIDKNNFLKINLKSNHNIETIVSFSIKVKDIK